jgi:peptide/nickel transport system permease protein
MLGQGRQLLATAPHVSLIPGAFIFVVVAMFNLLGDGLRDALDPRYTRPQPPRTDDEPSRDSEASDAETVKDPLLTVRSLTVRFGDVTAVRNVGFSLSRGEKVGIVGESGSGKSVTALSVLGLLDDAAHVRGTIRFDDLELENLPPSELDKLRGARIAWIPQDPTSSLHPLLSIGRQLTEGLELHQRLTREAARRRASELLEEVDLADTPGILRAFPNQLSGGMRQRVAIAMALSGDPELLVADEPTTALDVTTQANVLYCLNRLVERRGAALLFISHDLAVVSQLCDRILVMRRGDVVERGPVSNVLHSPAHEYTKRLLRSVPRLGDPAHILGGERS